MSSWTLWLILTLNSLPSIMYAMGTVVAVLILLFLIAIIEGNISIKSYDVYNTGINFLKKLVIAIVLLAVLIGTVLPSADEAFAIYGIPKLTQNQRLTETGKKLLTFTELYLKVKTKQLQGEKEK